MTKAIPRRTKSRQSRNQGNPSIKKIKVKTMPHDQPYLQAEKKIEEALKSGAMELDLSNPQYKDPKPHQLTELPESLGKLTQLQKLDLSNNQLTTLPDWLGLSQVDKLNLSSNQLITLPESVGQLRELKLLDLSANQLKSLPNSIGQLRELKWLSLSHNQLTRLPETMGNLVNLSNLYLGELLLEEFPEWIGKFWQLESLSLSNNKLEILPDWIANLKMLRIIYCRNNLLKDIPFFLLQLEHLEEIRLGDNPLNPRLAAAYKEGTLKDYMRAKASAMNQRKLKIFLCHASQDKYIVHELYQRLVAEGWIEPWLDAKKLLPGQDWQAEIRNAVESADNVIIFLSNTSINKDGFIQKELRLAKEIALEKSEGSIFLIPLRLDDCAVPRSLQIYQWADYFSVEKEQTYNKLLESLKFRLEDIKRKEANTK
jgi:Leucine-rich repeat (LRR) protein